MLELPQRPGHQFAPWIACQMGTPEEGFPGNVYVGTGPDCDDAVADRVLFEQYTSMELDYFPAHVQATKLPGGCFSRMLAHAPTSRHIV